MLVTPGERVDLVVTPSGKPGERLTLMSVLANRGFGTVEGRFPYDDLLSITFADLPAYVSPPLPEVRRTIEPLPQRGATAVDIELTVVQTPDGPAHYLMTGPRYSAATQSVIYRLVNERVPTARRR